MSDTDDSFNFLISMCYTQLFNLLCEKADDVYGGRLPVHVRCLIDECANIGQIPKLEKLVATIRSREISACLVLQAQSQLKAIYKDNADTIIGNMDTSIFLGGKEPTTLKELAAVLGKETIDTYNTGESRGRETSHSLNYQKLGKELMSQDELAVIRAEHLQLLLREILQIVRLIDLIDKVLHPKAPSIALWAVLHRKPVLQPGRRQGVAQEHGDRHGPHAARNRRDISSDLLHLGKVHIAAELTVLIAVHSHIDHNRAGLDHVCRDEFRFAHRSD